MLRSQQKLAKRAAAKSPTTTTTTKKTPKKLKQQLKQQRRSTQSLTTHPSSLSAKKVSKRAFSTAPQEGASDDQFQQQSSSDTELDDAQMKIAVALSGDMRKRVMAHKMRKPTLAERMATTSDLYHDKTLLEMTEDDIGILLPMKWEHQPKFAQHYLKSEAEKSSDGQQDHEGYWMVRSTTIDALNFIDTHTNRVTLHRPRKPDAVYNAELPNLAILYGHRGCSKSFTLAQAVDYATRRGDIVISVSAWDTMHDMDALIAPSIIPGHEGMYDQILKARRFLEHMATKFPDQLKSIPLTLPKEHYAEYGAWDRSEEGRFNAPDNGIQTPEMYPFPQNGIIPRPMDAAPGQTLYDLAAMGSWRSDLAGRAANDFLYEVKKQTKVPVFIGIDDVNAFAQKTDYMNPANLRTRLDSTRLTFVRGLLDCIENPPQRGSTMIATSSNFTSYRITSYLHRAGTKIRTTSYTVLEHQAMLEHYFTSKIILTPMEIEFFRRSQIVSGGMPRSLRIFAEAN